MELSLHPSTTNHYPLEAIFIKSADVAHWLTEMQLLDIDLQAVSAYVIPGLEVNSIYGCFVILPKSNNQIEIRNHTWCQKVGNQLYIPQYTTIEPQVSTAEINTLFARHLHFYHPYLGLIELETKINWNTLFTVRIEELYQQKPEPEPRFTEKIVRFRISAIPNDNLEDMLNDIAKKSNPKGMDDKPLSPAEKVRLSFYKKMMNNIEPEAIDEKNKPAYLKILKAFSKLIGSKDETKSLDQKQMNDYEELNRREKSQVDKLLELLKNDPEKALDFAIPIDGSGTSRGKDLGAFQMNRTNKTLSSLASLLGDKRSGSGGGGFYSMEEDEVSTLQSQYRQSAEQLIKDKKYLQASYIYIKLLNDKYAAASMFEDAKLYKEAGDVYDKLINNQEKAGECYEKGKLYAEAIEMYKTKEMYEKVGDLYTLLYDREQANLFYQKVVDKCISNKYYLKAAKIGAEKMDQFDYAQSLLLEGWKKSYDTIACLGKYFSNIEDDAFREKEITRIFKEDIDKYNQISFLKVIKEDFSRNGETSNLIKDIAYQIVADAAQEDKTIVSQLIAFNKTDSHFAKDTIRYKQTRR